MLEGMGVIWTESSFCAFHSIYVFDLLGQYFLFICLISNVFFIIICARCIRLFMYPGQQNNTLILLPTFETHFETQRLRLHTRDKMGLKSQTRSSVSPELGEFWQVNTKKMHKAMLDRPILLFKTPVIKASLERWIRSVRDAAVQVRS